MRWLSRSMLSVINAISKSRCLSFLHTVAIFSDSIYTKSDKFLSFFQPQRSHHNITKFHQNGYPLRSRKEQSRQLCRIYKSCSMDYIAKIIRIIVTLIVFHNSLFQQLTILTITTFQYAHLMDSYLI